MIDIIVEEPSAAELMSHLIPRIIPDTEYKIITFSGKSSLIHNLQSRVRGYVERMLRDSTLNVIITIDRDNQDCHELKRSLVLMIRNGIMHVAPKRIDELLSRFLVRIIIEELEAWYFGDVAAIRQSFPRVSANLGRMAKYRNPDAIAGGTWEALHRILRANGYFHSFLPKQEVAARIGPHMNVECNASKSFEIFKEGLRRFA